MKIRNGKGKEYCEGKLLFEGEYLNGKRNGKGKEYYYKIDEVKFEWEYLNGKICNGKGYDHNGEIVFEIKNGKGHIKLYTNYEGQLLFEGEYLYGERNGKGKEYYKGQLEFEGEYLNGKKMGKEKNIIIINFK